MGPGGILSSLWTVAGGFPVLRHWNFLQLGDGHCLDLESVWRWAPHQRLWGLPLVCGTAEVQVVGEQLLLRKPLSFGHSFCRERKVNVEKSWRKPAGEGPLAGLGHPVADAGCG